MTGATSIVDPNLAQTALIVGVSTLLVVGVIAIPVYGPAPLLAIGAGILTAVVITGCLTEGQGIEAEEETDA